MGAADKKTKQRQDQCNPDEAAEAQQLESLEIKTNKLKLELGAGGNVSLIPIAGFHFFFLLIQINSTADVLWKVWFAACFL